jgi:hypothetical protein
MTVAAGRLRFPWLPVLVFLVTFVGHACYLRHLAAAPTAGWADLDVGTGPRWGFASYVSEQDYYVGFSYALGAAFAAWALIQYLRTRQAVLAVGAAGGVTLVGALLAGGCFLIGCCGSPMLGVYLGLFGAKALGVGKPLMAMVTLLSVGWGYGYFSRKLQRGSCGEQSCVCKGAGQ